MKWEKEYRPLFEQIVPEQFETRCYAGRFRRRAEFYMRGKVKSISGAGVMIRKLQKTDIDTVSQIWLDANRDAHDFIPAEYWENNFLPVKKMLLQAEVYVYMDECKNEIEGFVGLDQEYIAGIFVRKEARSGGIGKALLDFVKEKKQELTLNVYRKNERAVRFYEREGFQIIDRTVDKSTDEKEYLMKWKGKGSIC